MTIYFLEIVIMLILGIIIFYNGTSKSKKKFFLLSSGIVLFLVMALRDKTIGTDTELYCTVFKNIANSTNVFTASDASILYAIYNKVVFYIFGLNSQWIIVCNSFIIILLVSIFIYKNSDNVVMSVLYFMLFYHYFQAFNLSRQYIAILLAANSFYFAKRNKLKGFLILSILAIMIHNTAIVFLPVGLILFTKLNLKKVVKYSAILGIMLYLYDNIINLFLIIFPRYSMYFTGSKLFFNTGEGKRIIITILYLFIVILAMLLIRKRNKKVSEENKIEIQQWYDLLFLMVIAILCGFLSMKSVLLSRIELYFSIFAIIFIPSFVEKIPKQKYLIYMLSIVILLIPTYIMLSGNIAEIIPYKTFF